MRGGLCDDLANWTAENAQAAKHLGASVARVPLGWNRADEPAVTDGIKTIRDAGLRPLICVWFHESDVPSPHVYATHCAAYARRFPQAMIQLLNEPASEIYGSLRVEQTVEYVQEATRAVRLAQPAPKLIAPALSPAPGWTEYFQRMWDDIPRGVDPALHLYPRSDRPLSALEGAYKMADAHGPVHVTEMGFIRSVYGAKRQAELTEAALKRLAELGAATTVVYRAAKPVDASEWEDEADLSVLDQPRLRSAYREGMD